MKNAILSCLLLSLSFTGCAQNSSENSESLPATSKQITGDRVIKSEEQWKTELTRQEYYVLRQQGTEAAFSGDYYDHKGKGIYTCAACGNELFSSKAKFRSGTGWPSFYQPISEEKVGTEEDRSYGMVRTEVHCARCDGHLGHIFKDGPKPTGLRYCINSVSLDFKE